MLVAATVPTVLAQSWSTDQHCGWSLLVCLCLQRHQCWLGDLWNLLDLLSMSDYWSASRLKSESEQWIYCLSYKQQEKTDFELAKIKPAHFFAGKGDVEGHQVKEREQKKSIRWEWRISSLSLSLSIQTKPCCSYFGLCPSNSRREGRSPLAAA